MFDNHKITHTCTNTHPYTHTHTCVMWSPLPAEHLIHTCSCIFLISNAGLNQEANLVLGSHPQGQAGLYGHVPNCPEPQPCVPGWNFPSSDSPGWMLTCSCRTTNSTSSLGRTATASPRMLTCRPRGAVRGHCSCTGLCCRSTPPSHTLDTTFRYLGGWGRVTLEVDSGLMGRDCLSWGNSQPQPL